MVEFKTAAINNCHETEIKKLLKIVHVPVGHATLNTAMYWWRKGKTRVQQNGYKGHPQPGRRESRIARSFENGFARAKVLAMVSLPISFPGRPLASSAAVANSSISAVSRDLPWGTLLSTGHFQPRNFNSGSIIKPSLLLLLLSRVVSRYRLVQNLPLILYLPVKLQQKTGQARNATLL